MDAPVRNGHDDSMEVVNLVAQVALDSVVHSGNVFCSKVLVMNDLVAAILRTHQPWARPSSLAARATWTGGPAW